MKELNHLESFCLITTFKYLSLYFILKYFLQKKKKNSNTYFFKKKIQLSQNWQTTAKEGKMIIHSFPQNFYIILF